MQRIGSDLEIIAGIMEVRDATVLDVGCGTGVLARALADQGARVIGLEAPTLLAGLARPAGPQGCSFAVCPGERLCIADRCVDLVVFMASLHHVPPPLMQTALAEAGRVLRDGGRLVVVEPVAEPGSYAELVCLADDEREQRRSAAEALHAAAAVGLRPLDEWLVYFERTFDDYTRLVEAHVEAPEDRERILAEARELASSLAAAENRTLGSHVFRSVCRVSCLAGVP